MRMRGSGIGLCATAAAVALFGAACAGRAPSPPPPELVGDEREAYKIGVTDVLMISVWRNPELTVEVPVRADGMISVPLVDDVPAEGLTPPELKAVITRELAEFVASPDVTVIIRQMNSRFVSVIGEVAQTTRVPLTRNLRVLEAIASVGGFTPFADRGDVRIVRRQDDGSEVEYRFDYDAYIKGSAPGTNLVLRPGDTIIVPD
jgi:polysaccharide export outer membrane protein